jgi:P27 family predicted phage terminase small subunit
MHRLAGTWRKGRHDGLDPVAPGRLIEAPAYLSAAQRTRFLEIVAAAPANVLRRWDGATLAGYCIAESAVIEANLAFQREGQDHLLDKTEKGALTLSALLKVQARFLPIMKSFGELLGFSPTSRASLKIDDGAISDPAGDDMITVDGEQVDRWGYIAKQAEDRRDENAQRMKHKRTRKAKATPS